MSAPLEFAPDLRERVWGGRRFPSSGQDPIGEAWVVGEGNLVTGGPYDGRRLGELADQLGLALLGRRAAGRGERRFPLLLKLIDTAAWLSVQVHPNDEQARALEGPGAVGKTEAWYVLAAEPGAELISGPRVDVPREAIAEAIERGGLGPLLESKAAAPGDVFLVPTGTLHAVGPGLFIYEIQQASDITYRVYDWDRPGRGDRALHPVQSLGVVDPSSRVRRTARTATMGPGRHPLVRCPYFELELLVIEVGGGLEIDLDGESFEIITAVRGEPLLSWTGGTLVLGPTESALLPADLGPARISMGSAGPEGRILVARLPH